MVGGNWWELVGIGGNWWELVGICGNLWEFVGICGNRFSRRIHHQHAGHRKESKGIREPA